MRYSYICSQCGKRFEISPEYLLCPDCAQEQQPDKPLCGILEVAYDGKLPDRFESYDLLCVEKRFFPPIPVGNTPLWGPERLRKRTGFPRLYLKDDTVNPTGSLKDRASFLVAAFAVRHGIKRIVVASTGNAASSMAGVGAAAGLAVTIFLPESAPKAKRAQAFQYGADIRRISGTYDKAYEESLSLAGQPQVLSRNTAYNPLTIEGKKTVALEMVLQLRAIEPARAFPHHIFVPTGDGVILSGVYKGLQDLLQFGIIDEMPHIVVVQAEGSCAITRALSSGDFSAPVDSDTMADSISVDVPKAGYYALDKLRRYNGTCVTVSDEAILSAQKELSSMSGLFAEPAAAASYAGFLAFKKELPRGESVVLLITGNGLKDVDAALRLHEMCV